MDYETIIKQEWAKINLLRAKQALIATQIAESEQFIGILEKRADKGGDALDKALEEQLAAKSVSPPVPHTAIPPIEAEEQKRYDFPKIRSDSMWPYVIRFMASKELWRVEELIAFALENRLVKTESAIRSSMSSLKTWNFVENDTPGKFSLKPKGRAFLETLKPNQFTIGDVAGATRSETIA